MRARLVALLALAALSVAPPARADLRPANCNSLGRVALLTLVVSHDLRELKAAVWKEWQQTSGHAAAYNKIYESASAMEVALEQFVAFSKPYLQVCPLPVDLDDKWGEALQHFKTQVDKRIALHDAITARYGLAGPHYLSPVGDAWTLFLADFEATAKSFYSHRPRPEDGGGGGRDDYFAP